MVLRGKEREREGVEGKRERGGKERGADDNVAVEGKQKRIRLFLSND